MCASTSLLSLLLLSIAGAVLCASIKGGNNGTKSGRWTPPKDWDWSVTPGRLIPVSEATDDLPTPGYRMSQLQQRIPAHHDHQPIPIMNIALAQNESNPEEKVVVIGQTKPTVVNGDTNNDLPTIQQQETTEHMEQLTLKDYKQQSGLNEEELILLHEEPFVQRREEVSFNASPTTEKPDKIPVIEEVMKKVELPEICSITGLGCRDPLPKPQNPEAAQNPQIEEHPEVISQHEIEQHEEAVEKTEETFSTTVRLEEQATEVTSATIQVAHEEHTTNHDQLPSDSYQIDQQVVQQKPEGLFVDHSVYTQQGNSEEHIHNNSTFLLPSNGSEIAEELIVSINPLFNTSQPQVVHSVLSSVSEYVGSNKTSKHTIETSGMTENQANISYSDSQQIEEAGFQQQEQQLQQQQVQFDSFGQLPQEQKEEHQIDEQKLLQIADSWDSTGSNSTIHTSERRMDNEEMEDKKKEAEEAIQKHEVPVEETAKYELANHESKEEITELLTNSTGSPSIGDRIESYWKAATGYVSKALNF